MGGGSVEDQQPEPGDLTAAEEADAPEAGGDGEITDDTDDTEVTAAAADAPPNPAVTPRWRGRLVGVAVALAAALFVGAGGYAGAALQPYLADRAAVATKLNIARAASNAITALWTYTPDDIDTLPDRVADYLTGDLAAQYRKDIEAIEVRQKQGQISLDSQVVGVAVDSVTADDARVLVYTNTTWSSPQTKDIPGLQYRSYRVSLQRDAARWRVTKLALITNFSLTPQF